MNELMPCPFCGNAKNLAMVNEKHDHSGGYFIACPECGASTIMRYAMGDDPKPLLIEAWNRRAALAAQPGSVGEWKLSDDELTLCHSHAVLSKKHDGGDPSFTTLLYRQIEAAIQAKLAAAPTEAKPEATQQASGERKPYAYAVYFPDQPTEELVHDLDELCEDMTNREHTITELFSALSTPAQQDAVDAERFRFLTDVAEGSFWDRIRPMCKEDLILAIDAAISAPKGGV